jgi:hypothetical protein
MPAPKSYKQPLRQIYGDTRLKKATGLFSEYAVMDFLSEFSRVERTERIDEWHAVDMYFTPFEEKYDFQIGRTYHCQCKGSLAYHIENSWGVSFNKSGLGIQRFLNSELPVIVSNTQSIPSWRSPYDGKILLINAKLLKQSYDPSSEEDLKIPRDPKYFKVLADLTQAQQDTLRIISASEYTY